MVERLLKRSDFLNCAQGRRWNTAAFAIQVKSVRVEGLTRLGFTVSRKNGGSVIRNRIRRRLKAAAASMPGDVFAPGHDYVIVARPAALTMSFAGLKDELIKALAGVTRPQRPKTDRRPTRTEPPGSPATADVET